MEDQIGFERGSIQRAGVPYGKLGCVKKQERKRRKRRDTHHRRDGTGYRTRPVHCPRNWQRGVVVAQAALRVAAEGDWTGGGRLARRLSTIADCRMVGAPRCHELIALLN